LTKHPEVEIVSRDRCGLYAQGAREGAPQARQVADRFHLLQNLRETIETQLSRADRSTGRWAEGCVCGRELFHEIKLCGYTGSFSHLEQLLAKWRRANNDKVVTLPPVPEPTTAPTTTITMVPRAVDPMTGWMISPIVAASLCIKPRGLLTPGQAAKVKALKNASPDFATMRRLAMRFRGILRSKDIEKFRVWLDDAQQSGIYAMQRFARTVRRDVDAVTNALTEGWSNGQTEGQINRLKTLKRAMYGRAGPELLRARMLPLHSPFEHGK
jgi:transposase